MRLKSGLLFGFTGWLFLFLGCISQNRMPATDNTEPALVTRVESYSLNINVNGIQPTPDGELGQMILTICPDNACHEGKDADSKIIHTLPVTNTGSLSFQNIMLPAGDYTFRVHHYRNCDGIVVRALAEKENDALYREKYSNFRKGECAEKSWADVNSESLRYCGGFQTGIIQTAYGKEGLPRDGLGFYTRHGFKSKIDKNWQDEKVSIPPFSEKNLSISMTYRCD
ncbi:MAG: hypothetical protein AAF203_06840 [Pseudomonadota bacterium]